MNNSMTLYIKNMVCSRCVMVVKQELEKLGIKPLSIRLGEAELESKPSSELLTSLGERLQLLGFEILDDLKQSQIEKIKTSLIELIQNGELPEHFSLSDFLTRLLLRDYSYISRLFSEVEGITLEQYFILQKIEKAKELLVYGEMNASEISLHLGYSSAAHLSTQFKKVTGLTPTAFKKLGGQRKFLDKIKDA